MNIDEDKRTGFLQALAGAQAGLCGLARQSETEIAQAAHVFKSLAGQADAILKKAAAIVACVEAEGTGAVLAQVQSLCVAVRLFLEQRLKAATTILEALESEERLLGKLTLVMQRQEAVASQLKALSVLTNVVVAQLGSVGNDFHLLARELSAFSRSVSAQTRDLANHTGNSQCTIGESRRELAVDLPRLRGEMTRMQDDIGKTLQAIDSGLGQLAIVPGQFKASAEQTAQQIAGVVSAIQGHDITRQQIEHVQQALQIIGSQVTTATNRNGNGNGDGQENDSGDGNGLAHAYAGLTIQSCQLKAIQQIATHWTSQLARCLGGIKQLSASQVSEIGTIVLNQERALSSQLAHVEHLQQESQDYSSTIQQTLAGLSNLLELVNESLGQSQDIRHRLRFLTFNSIVEANRLGKRGIVVSAIANLIKGVSAEWNAIADESGAALDEIMNLAAQTNQLMAVFSEVAGQELRADRMRTESALDKVREAAAFVAKEATEMQEVTERMRRDTASAGNTGDHLDACFGGLGRVLGQIEDLARRLETDDPQIAGRSDVAETEKLFAAFYTTEVERSVMRAALQGTPLPVLEQSFAGNEVELF